MQIKHNSLLVLSLFISILLLSFSCVPANDYFNQATQTAQADRASRLATAMAERLAITYAAENAEHQATAQVLNHQLQSARDWPILISDPFDKVSND